MGRNHSWFNLLTSNRPKVTNRLFISKPYRPCHRSSINTNPMSIHCTRNPNHSYLYLIHIFHNTMK
uniref:Uncharacterized protein n=1 Tax=Chelydra serpentina TaxID=8475 RepID=A0A8C3SNZ4_CHESE